MADKPELNASVLYNPRQLNRETLKAVFVARRKLLERMVSDLRAPRPSHQLVIGPRGMGKTSLLRRLGIAIEEDAELSKRLQPMTFPEEQYNVGSLGEFYLNCIDALADYLDKQAYVSKAGKFDRIVAELRKLPEAELVDKAEAVLVEYARENGKQLVLLVDNLSLVFDRLNDKEKWRLREWLSRTEQRPVLIGAAVRFIKDTVDYGQAFYEFLRPHTLTGCDTSEAREVLRELARVFKAPRVDKWLDADPGRLAVLNRLAGGSPRTLVMLFQLLAQGIDGPVIGELERLLDLATPLYKSRFEELPDQAQRVLDALALHWDPATRRDLETAARIEGNAISSQLNRLVKDGVVEEVSIPGEAKTAYQVAERFFNIWYLMRASRRSRHQVRWLVEFLKAIYTEQERVDIGRKLQRGDGDPVGVGRNLLAVSDSISDPVWKSEFRNSAFVSFARADKHKRIDLDLCDIEPDWREKLDGLKEPIEKEKELLSEIAKKPILAELQAELYFELGLLYQTLTNEPSKAEEAYRKCINIAPMNAEPWSNIGLLLSEKIDRQREAEKSFRKAIEIEPELAYPWNNLGNLLADRLGRYEEAEVAFRQAIAIDPDYANVWNNLARLLSVYLSRNEEAETAFRTAIGKEPENPNHVNCLAWCLLVQRKSLDEAEEFARQSVRLQSNPANQHTLACILAARGKSTESLPAIRNWLDSLGEELTGPRLRETEIYFRELVRYGQAEIGICLLEELNRAEAWRPLTEALRAAGKEDRGSLQRINPEQRDAAERIYDFLVEGSQQIETKPTAKTKKPPRKIMKSRKVQR